MLIKYNLKIKSFQSLRYQIVRSQRGKNVILFRGFTYAKTTPRRWICSTNSPDCKAKLKLDRQGNIIDIVNVHIHPARKLAIIAQGRYIKLS